MFDFNAKLGPWPYRPVRGLEALLESMDALGIERAVVSSLESVHFLNPQEGNERLAVEIRAHRDRLMPFTVIRPNLARFEEDLARCLDDLGMKGVVLYPNYHEYNLDGAAAGAIAAAMESRGLPVCVQTGLEDLRRQYRSYKTPEVPVGDIAAFARAHPNAMVVALGLKFGQPDLAGAPWPANLYFDTSNYETLGDLEFAVERFGADRIVFGTNFPLFNPQANVDKVRRADIPGAARVRIARENALRLLGAAL